VFRSAVNVERCASLPAFYTSPATPRPARAQLKDYVALDTIVRDPPCHAQVPCWHRFFYCVEMDCRVISLCRELLLGGRSVANSKLKINCKGRYTDNRRPMAITKPMLDEAAAA
jgi:hypothetical protein